SRAGTATLRARRLDTTRRCVASPGVYGWCGRELPSEHDHSPSGGGFGGGADPRVEERGQVAPGDLFGQLLEVLRGRGRVGEALRPRAGQLAERRVTDLLAQRVQGRGAAVVDGAGEQPGRTRV